MTSGDYRTKPGRPGRDEAPSPVTRLRDRIPQAMDDELSQLASARGISHQSAVREAIATWIRAQREGLK